MKSTNYFPIVSVESGDFVIKDGILSVKNDYPIGSYIYIPGAVQRRSVAVGSVLNEGVYLMSDSLITLTEARDEVWSGAISLLALSGDFLNLVELIKDYVNTIEKDPKQAVIISESQGKYSYTKATTENGLPPRWQQVFRQALNPYRCMFPPRIL